MHKEDDLASRYPVFDNLGAHPRTRRSTDEESFEIREVSL